MPIFHTTNIGTGEIMTITSAPDNKDMVVVYIEDPEEPGRLIPDQVYKKDLVVEIASQSKKRFSQPQKRI
ncbi:MAG: hypothetical protein V1803_02030 [Candidatus Roizmanbacteria bacterium]